MAAQRHHITGKGRGNTGQRDAADNHPHQRAGHPYRQRMHGTVHQGGVSSTQYRAAILAQPQCHGQHGNRRHRHDDATFDKTRGQQAQAQPEDDAQGGVANAQRQRRAKDQDHRQHQAHHAGEQAA